MQLRGKRANLTAFEQALLHEFERLETSFKELGASDTTSLDALTDWLKTLSEAITSISERQNKLEERLNDLSALLNTQNKSTENLITQVNRFIEAQDD